MGMWHKYQIGNYKQCRKCHKVFSIADHPYLDMRSNPCPGCKAEDEDNPPMIKWPSLGQCSFDKIYESLATDNEEHQKILIVFLCSNMEFIYDSFLRRLTFLFTKSADCTELLFKNIEGIRRRIRLFKEITGISLEDAIRECGGGGFYNDWSNLRKARNGFAHGSEDWIVSGGKLMHLGHDKKLATIFEDLPSKINSIRSEFLNVFMKVNNFVIENCLTQ